MDKNIETACNNITNVIAERTTDSNESEHFYKSQLNENATSDIAIMSRGHIWHLHKANLRKCPYFDSMFSGSWKESSQELVHIRIVNQHITVEALNAAFDSLYSSTIHIDLKSVTNILAMATFFHLQNIIDECSKLLCANLNDHTAVEYYELSCEYGCLDSKQTAFEWLETNLINVFYSNQKLLSKISIELMYDLVSSKDLYVIQTEFWLYMLLRTWMYLRLNFADGYEVQESETVITEKTIQDYFKNCTEENIPFLLTANGQPFLKPFRALRTQYLVSNYLEYKILANHNIIPKEWLCNADINQWKCMLKGNHKIEQGPQELEPQLFYKNCMRLGRILATADLGNWRGSSFELGFDLMIAYVSHIITIKRERSKILEGIKNLSKRRQFMIRLSVSSTNSKHQPIFSQKTELLSLSLEENEEYLLMIIDRRLVHPLLISANLLVALPPSMQSINNNVSTANDANIERTYWWKKN